MLRFFVVLVLVGCAFAQSTEVPTVQPSVFDCSSLNHVDGNYASSNCTQYYRCYPGSANALVYTCIEGTVFNAVSGECDWPFNVAPPCGTWDGTGTTGAPWTGIPATPSPHLCLGDPNNEAVPNCCTKYYSCDGVVAGNNAHVMDCPSTTVFNPATDVCDWPHNVPGCETSACTL
uniref:chondroitin proteoglycan-2-like n=1 Tax=Styela clava TaxID=7725 RepID=UPI00193978C9|nr:chondroitin proteoglycan-2-like [Styela clava]